MLNLYKQMLDLLSLSYNKINYKYNKLTKGQQKKEKKESNMIGHGNSQRLLYILRC